MKRIINKQTGIFLRDDFTFDEETEIGLDVTPAQGFYLPKWDGEKWIEGLTDAEILDIKNKSIEQVSVEQQLADLQYKFDELKSQL